MPYPYRRTLSLSLTLTGMACAGAGGSVMPGSSEAGPPPEVRETSTGTIIRIAADQPGVNTEVSAPVDRVWAVLPLVYSELGITGQVLDTKDRTYGSRRFTQRRIGGRGADEYVRCAFQGAGPSAAGGYRTQLSIVSRVESSSSNCSILTTQVAGSATAVEGTSTDPVRCVSTGDLERRIAAMVSERVRN